jgi:hypothetical protein
LALPLLVHMADLLRPIFIALVSANGCGSALVIWGVVMDEGLANEANS